MIAMHNIDGRNCPVVVCDQCGERINDGFAVVTFEGMADGYTSLRFLHKSQPCNRPNAGYSLESWNDLDVFLHWLVRNAGVVLDDEVAGRAQSLETF